MTVIYDAKSHRDVLFSLRGSIWPSVLPWCIWNTAVKAIVYLLRSHGSVDLTFEANLGYQFSSMLVSFFVVININTTYNRFWECRGHVGVALNAVSRLAARAAAYSANDTTDAADRWRKLLKEHIIDLVDKVVYIIREERAALVNVYYATDEDQFEAAGALAWASGRESIVSNTLSRIQENGPVNVAFLIDKLIIANGDYLQTPLNPQREQDLLARTSTFMAEFHNLLKFATTPVPFVLVQMGRTILFIWVLLLTFVVSNNSLFFAMFCVVIITYGFMGLTLAEVEMHDPLGRYPNDIELDVYAKVCYVISMYLHGANLQIPSNFSLLGPLLRLSNESKWKSS